MKKRRKISARKKRYGKISVLTALIMMFALISLAVVINVISSYTTYKINGQGSNIIMLWPKPDEARPNLQLKTFPYITLAPYIQTIQTETTMSSSSSLTSSSVPNIPGVKNACPLDAIRPEGSTCTCIDSNAIACPDPAGMTGSCQNGTVHMPFPPGPEKSWYCMEILGPGLLEPPPTAPSGCMTACIAKPVVYLYPKEPTLVSVRVKAPGKVFISDPLYPENGWENVLAQPDGTLQYNGKIYSELFYETEISQSVPMPEAGIIIPVEQLESTIQTVIAQYGLQGTEQKEFLAYWIPVLQKLHSPYIFFSILDKPAKEAIDTLIITPEPDTRIELIAYFKPIRQPVPVQPLQLPLQAPERNGFTEVEWGGTIGR